MFLLILGLSVQHVTGFSVTLSPPPLMNPLTVLSSSTSAADNDVDIDADADIVEKMSRPERKALERQKKAEQQQQSSSRSRKNGRRHHDFTAHNAQLANSTKDTTRYDLHSTELPRLTKDGSTADEVMRAIKRAQNLHDAHDLRNIERFLLEEVDETYAYGYRGSLLARLAVAALHMKEHDIALKAIRTRRVEHRSSMLPLESAAIIRGMLRVHNVTDAVALLDDELSLPLTGTPIDTFEAKDKIRHRCLSIASIVSRHFFETEPTMAIQGCDMLCQMGPIVRESGLTAKDMDMPWLRIIQGAAQCESNRRQEQAHDDDVDDNNGIELPVNLVYAVLKAMNTFPSNNDDRVYEALSNALVRRTCFITGAVAMDGMPKADRGEAVFIGRSNVGKSSLVNMVTNRKSLAYTSKRPGKTQQFNFFSVNDKLDVEKEIRYGDVVTGAADPDSFYIVDLPGFGFAKVPQKQRQQWSDLMAQYLSSRKTIRVLFHLVDARHGPIDEDVRIMRQVGESLPENVKYVVVLTKSDKNVKDTNKLGGRVSKDVMENLRETMRNAKVGKAPVILTSASTKMGRDDLWRYLKLAADY